MASGSIPTTRRLTTSRQLSKIEAGGTLSSDNVPPASTFYSDQSAVSCCQRNS